MEYMFQYQKKDVNLVLPATSKRSDILVQYHRLTNRRITGRKVLSKRSPAIF